MTDIRKNVILINMRGLTWSNLVLINLEKKRNELVCANLCTYDVAR